jgi:hypothetical protein
MKDYSGPNLTIDMSLNTKVWKKYNISQIWLYELSESYKLFEKI